MAQLMPIQNKKLIRRNNMNWLKIAGIFLKKAIKSIDLATILAYVIQLAKLIIDLTPTKKDDYLLAVLEAIIDILKYSFDKSIYQIGNEIASAIAEISRRYEEFGAPIAKNAINRIEYAAIELQQQQFENL